MGWNAFTLANICCYSSIVVKMIIGYTRNVAIKHGLEYLHPRKHLLLLRYSCEENRVISLSFSGRLKALKNAFHKLHASYLELVSRNINNNTRNTL